MPRKAWKGSLVLLVLLIESQRLGHAQQVLPDEVRHSSPVALLVVLERLQREAVGDEGVAPVSGGFVEDATQVAGQRVLGIGHAFLIPVRQHGELVVYLARLDERVVPQPKLDVVQSHEDVQQHLLEFLAFVR